MHDINFVNLIAQLFLPD